MKISPARLSAAGLGWVLWLGGVAAGRADELADNGRTIYQQHRQAVVTVQALVRSRVSMPGMGTQTNESRHSVSGTVVSGSGLTVVSLSALDPSEALKNMAAGQDRRLKVEAELGAVDMLLPNGSSTPAEVVLRDTNLDLALVQPRARPAAAMDAVDLTQAGKAELLDQVVALNRLGPAAGLGYSASAERIAAVVDQPRRFYVPDANMTTATLGAPAFTLDGKLLGIFLIRTVGKGPPAGTSDTPGEKLTAIILPAAEILKATQRVAGSDGKEGK